VVADDCEKGSEEDLRSVADAESKSKSFKIVQSDEVYRRRARRARRMERVDRLAIFAIAVLLILGIVAVSIWLT